MAPEFVRAMSALVFFWEDFSVKVDGGSIPLLWKVLLQTRNRIQKEWERLNEEQQARLQRADAIVRAKLAMLLRRDGHFDDYCRLRDGQDPGCWWYFLE